MSAATLADGRNGGVRPERAAAPRTGAATSATHSGTSAPPGRRKRVRARSKTGHEPLLERLVAHDLAHHHVELAAQAHAARVRAHDLDPVRRRRSRARGPRSPARAPPRARPRPRAAPRAAPPPPPRRPCRRRGPGRSPPGARARRGRGGRPGCAARRRAALLVGEGAQRAARARDAPGRPRSSARPVRRARSPRARGACRGARGSPARRARARRRTARRTASTTSPPLRVAVELLPDEGGHAVEVEDRVEVGPAPGERHEHVLVADPAADHARASGPRPRPGEPRRGSRQRLGPRPRAAPQRAPRSRRASETSARQPRAAARAPGRPSTRRPRPARPRPRAAGRAGRPRSAFVRQRRARRRERRAPDEPVQAQALLLPRRAPRRRRAAAGARRRRGGPSRRGASAGSMQRPVTVSRTWGNEARQSRSSSSPNGTSTPSPAAAGARRGRGPARPARVARARRPAGEAQAAAEGEAHARAASRSSPSGVSGSTSVRHRSSARRPASSSQRTRARSGSDGATKASGAARQRLEPAPQARAAGRRPERGGNAARPTTASAARSAAASGTSARAAAARARRRPDVDRLALEHAPEVEPLHEGEHEAVLEGGVERELQQQVLGARAAAGAGRGRRGCRAHSPSRVEGEEAGGRDDAAVQLHDPAPVGVAEGPRVVAARHLGEARLARAPPRASGEALEGEDVHVRHRPVRLDVVDRLREDHALERQAAHAARLEEREARGRRGRSGRACGRAAARRSRAERARGSARPRPAARARSPRGAAPATPCSRAASASAAAARGPRAGAGSAAVTHEARAARPRAFDSSHRTSVGLSLRGCQTRAAGVGRGGRARVPGGRPSGRVAVVALLPLYGDVRPSAAVSHPEWARMMLRGLDLLADAPGVNDTAAQAFATLSGRDSRSWPADQYVRGAARRGVRGGRATAASARAGGIGEAVYALGIARRGDYRLRLHVSRPRPGRGRAHEGGLGRGPALVHRARRRRSMGWVDAGVAAPRPRRLRRDGAPARGQRPRVRRARPALPAPDRAARRLEGARRSRPPRTWR